MCNKVKALGNIKCGPTIKVKAEHKHKKGVPNEESADRRKNCRASQRAQIEPPPTR